jgi:threonylcarbamoyladenosine tRNA methylthiotransferase MtaB
MGVDLVTLGCRLNLQESEAVKQLAEGAGLDDVVVVNTCAVTTEAVRQARQTIRRIGRERPGARIVVTGCAAQIAPGDFAGMPEVARVIGNHDKAQGATWAALAGSNSFAAGAPRLADGGKAMVSDIMAVRGPASPLDPAFEGRTRAFVQVQNGCDHRCTFCVIPFGRGASRSVPMDAVVAQVRALSARGAREVVLTGVDVTSYGKDLPGAPSLGMLVRTILRQAPELPRLRLSSIDAVEVDAALKEAFASEPRLMPHLHLSLQSGDDLILKRMKRRHSRADAISFCVEMRRLRPDMVFGADLIAGFPTEDEAMFARSRDIIAACGVTWLHVFPYSARPGTPAARMPQLPGPVVAERARLLREAGRDAQAAYLASQVGRPQTVLTERGDVGRTEGFAPVAFPRGVGAGEIRRVLPAATDGGRLIAA